MKSIFILIRGNSSSGKTVLANELQKYFGYEECLVLHQDNIRRDILHANDHSGTPAIDLIRTLVSCGENHCIGRNTRLKKWWREDDYLNYQEQRLSSGNTRIFLEKIIQDIIQNAY
ncbi:hypothetical protein [Weissella sagaensis]|uniref:hypothetical protein n=1 Tax=Weissella sagaensis TaxID=2559928 RepID=UPI00214AD1B9|nr:hypothetical protein [Weissella sagaensis]